MCLCICVFVWMDIYIYIYTVYMGGRETEPGNRRTMDGEDETRGRWKLIKGGFERREKKTDEE